VKKLIPYLIVILVATGIIFFNNHFKRLRVYIKEAKLLSEEKKRLMEENKRLRERIKELRSDPTKYEDIARRELGMVKKGEIKYSFIKE